LQFEASQLPTVLLPATDIETAESPRVQTAFVTTVSHELRGPLTAMSGALGLLINDPDKTLSRPMARLLMIAHSSSQKLVRLVNGILDDETDQGMSVTKRVVFLSAGRRTIETDRGLGSASANAAICGLVGRAMADVERDLILATLAQCLGNRTHAAGILAISIRTLRNKLNAYTAQGITIPPPGGGDMHVTHRDRSAQVRNSSRRSRMLHRGERRHAVL
jgi:hypothetical protein